PGVRVVFALRLLLPGGAGLNPPKKNYARANATPPRISCAFLFLRWCISIHLDVQSDIKIYHPTTTPQQNGFVVFY
ncbi:hypothetical protein, partial [Enterobacter hormaechei]